MSTVWNKNISLDLFHNHFRSGFGLAEHSENVYPPRSLTTPWKEVKRKIMERVEKALKLPNAQFKRVIGTTKPVFQKMLDVLQVAYDTLHEPGGAEPDLTVGDKLLIALQYYREYRTMEQAGESSPTHKTRLCHTQRRKNNDSIGLWNKSITEKGRLRCGTEVHHIENSH